MNQTRSINKLSEKELEQGIPIEASWHAEYNDTAYIYFGSLPFQLTEGDILIIFSQYGIPVHLKLVRDKETGKSKGFGWLKFEDQRSTILAVDNLNGASILGRVIRVDHAFYEEKENDEEYEALLEEELKNDFADLEEEQEVKESRETNKDDEFADPLLLMESLGGEKKEERKDHRHRSSRHRGERRHRHIDGESRHRSRSRSRTRRNAGDREHRDNKSSRHERERKSQEDNSKL